MTRLERKSYSTPIDVAIQEQFKRACKIAGLKQNEVLEQLMLNFSEGRITVTKTLSYEIRQNN